MTPALTLPTLPANWYDRESVFSLYRNVYMLPRALLFTAVLLTSSSAPRADTWGYVVGQMRVEQQASFCNTEAAVDELAGIFARFGAQTGFSALASSPECALQVHSFTPLALKQSIPIKLKSGGFYTVNTIRVVLENGQISYLFTTRKLQEAN